MLPWLAVEWHDFVCPLMFKRVYQRHLLCPRKHLNNTALTETHKQRTTPRSPASFSHDLEHGVVFLPFGFARYSRLLHNFLPVSGKRDLQKAQSLV